MASVTDKFPGSLPPCDNEECDACYPEPRFLISTERVQRLWYERTIKAATADEALRIYEDGTAWPSQYDDRYGEIVEQPAPTITQQPARGLAGNLCYHNFPSAKATP